jgi:serine/threonine protein kinase
MSRPRDTSDSPGGSEGIEREPTGLGGPKATRPASTGFDAHLETEPGERLRRPPQVGVGTIVGDRYRLVSRLGGGAMGDVFIAENLAIRLRVAVKLLKPELLADNVFRERFQQEAQAVASIEHPNVARFLDLVVGDPTFLVMEYVKGQTLAEKLRAKPMALAEAVQCAMRLCWALGAAHASGIIHRDLKPSNVIMTPDLEYGEAPKLIDFGLAKLAAQTEKSGLTRTGQVVGTPKYMAPEQIAGRPVDARSDLYALGCLLYEMLTGRTPFNGDDDVQVLYQQIHDPPTPLRKLVPDAPESLEKVLNRMLAKDPASRFPSVAECARALEQCMWTIANNASGVFYPGEGVVGPGLASGTAVMKAHRPRKPPSNPVQLAIVGLAALAIGVGTSFLLFRDRKPIPPDSGFLLVSEPPGATIVLDGKAIDRQTPTWVSGVPVGAHTVRFERQGVTPVTQTITLKDHDRAVVQVSLPPATHRVEVKSTPDGASVFLDGRLAFGETPTYVDITDDDFHELRIVKNGYQTVVKPVTPDDKEPQLTIPLKPETQSRGTLMVDANSAAEVWIDGLNTGYTTPTLGIQLPVGTHLVELRDGAGGKGQSRTVIVGQGQTVRILLGASETAGGTKGGK